MSQTNSPQNSATADRVSEILSNLSSESNVQAVVYSLFERADPEEVKKTVEALKRQLDLKHEDLKKSLSANHEHLFSCTDLLEQLGEYVTVSGNQIEKMKTMNSKIDDIRKIKRNYPQKTDQTTISSNPDIRIFKNVFFEECSRQVFEICTDDCLVITYAFEDLHQLGRKDVTHLKYLASLWQRLLQNVFHRIRASIVYGKELTQDVIDLMSYLIGKAFDDRERSVFSKLLMVKSFCECLELRISDDSLRSAMNDCQTMLRLLVESLFNSLCKENKQVDIIEVIKLAAMLDNRAKHPPPSVDTTGKPTKLLTTLFNLRLGNTANKFATLTILRNLLPDQATKPKELDSSQSQQDHYSFISLYQSKVASMVCNINLSSNKSQGHKLGHFRFDFVSRFYKNKEFIEACEQQSCIQPQFQLVNIISSKWKDYCKQVAESMTSSTDLKAIIEKTMLMLQEYKPFDDDL